MCKYLTVCMLHIADLLVCILRLSSFVICFLLSRKQRFFLLYPSSACSKLECLAFMFIHYCISHVQIFFITLRQAYKLLLHNLSYCNSYFLTL